MIEEQVHRFSFNDLAVLGLLAVVGAHVGGFFLTGGWICTCTKCAQSRLFVDFLFVGRCFLYHGRQDQFQIFSGAAISLRSYICLLLACSPGSLL